MSTHPTHADGSPFRRGHRRKAHDAEALDDKTGARCPGGRPGPPQLGRPSPCAGPRTFTTASLQGTYAYVNNTVNVGSLGLITFDGAGELTAEIKVSLPDETGPDGRPHERVRQLHRGPRGDGGGDG